MQDIVITRYVSRSEKYDSKDPAYGAQAADSWAGYIEPADRSWIMYFDAAGAPAVFWGVRDEDGGVVGDPINLMPSTAS